MANAHSASAEQAKVPLEMVTIPGGDFMMGNPDWEASKYTAHEGPLHRVRISKFVLSKHEVTQAQWQAVMGDNPSEFPSQGERKDEVANVDTDNFPVENINWYDAVMFFNRLSERAGLKPYYRLENKTEKEFTFLGETSILIRYDVTILGGNGYRLPSEAEWEYACRAGTRTRYSFGDAANGTKSNVNGKYTVGTEVKGPVRDKPLPVGSFKPNAFGLYDMHGNIAELCVDERDDKTYARRGELTVDPIVAQRVIKGGSSHIIRGGSWQVGAKAAMSFYRTGQTATSHSGSVGLRLARSITN